jgi:hypothetical protein
MGDGDVMIAAHDGLMDTMARTSDIAPTRQRPPWWRRPAMLVALAALAAIVAVVMVVFQPHKLFIDEKVFEELPGVVALDDVEADRAAPEVGGGTTGPGALPTPSERANPGPAGPSNGPLQAAAAEARRLGSPVAVVSGEFSSLDHPTSGTALLVVQPDGSRLVRLEGLKTDNGPDLRVVVSSAEVGAGDYSSLVELGRLKGNIGDQNYEIAADIELDSIRSVVIWCKRFSSAFGEAPLVVAG